MAFRYINPGDVSLLDKDCVTTTVTGTEYSKTGVAFTQTKSSAGITIPNFAESDDFWARFDAYIPSRGWLLRLFAPRTYTSGLYMHMDIYSEIRLYQQYGSTVATVAYGSAVNAAFKLGAINTFVVHIKLGDSNSAFIEISINGNSFSGNGKPMTYYTSRPAIAIIYSETANVFFSNIILSSEEISPKEKAIALPISNTLTNMTAGASGIYIANAVNQTLLQSVDVSTLVANYGASSAVTGIALIGNPAYKTAEGLASLIGLTKSGMSTVEHETCGLSDDTLATIFDGWTTENMTIAELQGMQFGWKVGE